MNVVAGIDDRIFRQRDGTRASGDHVVYWMQQAQRTVSNPALDFARHLATKTGQPLCVVFLLFRDVPDARADHYRFMMDGICETGQELAKQNIKLRIICPDEFGFPTDLAHNASTLVLDRGYLRWQRIMRDRIFSAPEFQTCEVVEIDTEAVVPVHLASDKEEYSAATLRRKLVRLINQHLEAPPQSGSVPKSMTQTKLLQNEYPGDTQDVSTLWQWALDQLRPAAVSGASYPVQASHSRALSCLKGFVSHKLKDYALLRNHPELDIQSNMSPYLHYGQISAREIIAILCESTGIPISTLPSMIMSKNLLEGLQQCVAVYAEELIIRRELAMNFCSYNDMYDSSLALPSWARKTLNDHLADPRESGYSLDRLELGETEDVYWNAAQRQLLQSGKMHNYMRMYWGKRILAWVPNVDEAFEILAYLNNKYELDGRDANSWAGIAWCFGKHDRPWAERSIYGMVRFMNAAGLNRKFDMKAYLKQWRQR